MLEVHFLGTGAMMPLPERKLASALVRRNGRLLLIDCGEGTQVAGAGIRLEHGEDRRDFHHALPRGSYRGPSGLLLTMGTMGRAEPVELIGPKGLELIVRCLRVIAPELPYELHFTELDGPEHALTFQDAAP